MTSKQKTNTFSFFVIVLLIGSLPYWQSIRVLELKLFDLQSNFLRDAGYETAQLENEVVLIGIDEQTYAEFLEPFALWHEHLAKLFKALAKAEVSVFGLDLAYPDRSYNKIIPRQDQKLLAGMLQLKRKAPFVLGITVEQNGQTRKVYPPFLSIAGNKGKAYVLWKLDPDRVVRRYSKNLGFQGQDIPTLTSTMAEHLEKTVSSGFINYFQGPKIQYIPFQQVLDLYNNKQWSELSQKLKGKAVILGTVLPFEDRHYQPVNLAAWEHDNQNFVPGVLIHIQALRNILNNGLISELDGYWNWILMIIILLFWFLGERIILSISLAIVGMLALVLLQSWLLLQHLYFPVFSGLIALFLVVFLRIGLKMFFEMLEKQKLRKLFGGYVSPQVMNEIINGNIQPGIHGERKKICVLFSDIRSFTTISEKLQPEEIILFLNQYLAEMTDAIQGNGGTIDKFMGDGIMAFFGAPQASERAVFQAFDAAREKLRKLDKLDEKFKQEGNMPEIKIGIGLHLGDAVVGNIGSEQRNEYTAIGDVVNTASRLEGLTKQAGYPIVVSSVVAQALKGYAEFDHIGEMPVKGRAPVDIFGWPPKQQ